MFIIIPILFSSNEKGVLTTVRDDLTHLITSPLRWKGSDYVKCGGIATTTSLIFLLDSEIRKDALAHNEGMEDITRIFDPFGSEYGIGLLGGGFIIGCILDNDRIKHLSLRATESALISTGFTYLIKFATGRKRPYLDEGPYQFTGPNLDAGRLSLPSSHTGFAFGIASYIAAETDNLLIDILCYGTAIMVGYSRIKKDKHWASDVFLGATIGITVGRTISRID